MCVWAGAEMGWGCFVRKERNLFFYPLLSSFLNEDLLEPFRLVHCGIKMHTFFFPHTNHTQIFIQIPKTGPYSFLAIFTRNSCFFVVVFNFGILKNDNNDTLANGGGNQIQ